MIDIEEHKKEQLRGLDDYDILSKISEESSEDLIFFGLSLLKYEPLKVRNLGLLKDVELKARLLNTISIERYMVKGIEGLYCEADCSYIKEGLLPKELIFGIEIEAVGEKTAHFIKNFKFKEWWIHDDPTLCEEGLEFTSPKMRYNKKDLTEIKRVCRFLEYNDFEINDLCGGHIHFGYKYINKMNELMNLLFLYSYFEKELYLISNNENVLCRHGVKLFGNSFVPVLDSLEFNYERGFLNPSDFMNSFINMDDYALTRKNKGLNIANIDDPKKNTVEFRIPNGTLNYDDWHKNIILYGSMMKLAKRVSSNKDDQSNFHDFVSVKRDSEHRVELFMNYLFSDDSIKNDYYSRYNAHLNDPIFKVLELKEFNLNRHKTLRKLAEK